MARLPIRSQWDEEIPSYAEVNSLPSVTVPDQSMTVSEIIARFTRSGVMPVKVGQDPGGQSALDPDFDPLDFDPAFWKAEASRLKSEIEELRKVDKNTDSANENSPSNE